MDRYFENPIFVKFFAPGERAWYYGVAYGDKIYAPECSAVVDVDEIEKIIAFAKVSLNRSI